MIDLIIEQIKNDGMAGVTLSGRNKAVLDFILLMKDTEPYETDENWFGIRLWLTRN